MPTSCAQCRSGTNIENLFCALQDSAYDAEGGDSEPYREADDHWLVEINGVVLFQGGRSYPAKSSSSPPRRKPPASPYLRPDHGSAARGRCAAPDVDHTQVNFETDLIEGWYGKINLVLAPI